MRSLGKRVSLRALRADLPHWKWKPERMGMGWRYIGKAGDRAVVVYAVAVFGGWEDHYETRWMAEEGNLARSFAQFRLDEEARRAER